MSTDENLSAEDARAPTGPRLPAKMAGWIFLLLAIIIGFAAEQRAESKFGDILDLKLSPTMIVLRSINPAALVATSIVLLIAGYNQGEIRIKAFGIELGGKSSLGLLWIAIFAAIMISVLSAVKV